MASIEELSLSDKEDAVVETGELASVQSRSERKARKALTGLGLKKVAGINRVTIRRPKNMLFVVSNPEVYKSASSDIYIVYGEAKSEDQSQQAQMSAGQQLQNATGGAADEDDDDDLPELEGVTGGDDDEPPALVGSQGDEPDEKDVEILIAQTSVSREKAVAALKESKGDLISAIMAATSA
ncbi:NAC domain-containing protein [Mrakia frigida]|uniref:Egd2p n=1 Tax=Mrakia frigida TaxID=29902 RepID=UPI003FCC1CD8